MNKKLLASLLRSRNEDGKILAIILADYHLYLLQEILSDTTLNPLDRDFVNFGYSYNSGMMNLHQQNQPGVLWVDIPARRAVPGIFYSWGENYKTQNYDKQTITSLSIKKPR